MQLQMCPRLREGALKERVRAEGETEGEIAGKTVGAISSAIVTQLLFRFFALYLVF